jgi:hypothetical protein
LFWDSSTDTDASDSAGSGSDASPNVEAATA